MHLPGIIQQPKTVMSALALPLLLLVSYARAGGNPESAPLPALPEYDGIDFSRQPAYDVSRIIDGDTIQVLMKAASVPIRLIGVETRGGAYPNRSVESSQKGAREFVATLLKGEKVYLLSEGSGDQRSDSEPSSAYVFRAHDLLFINTEIIRQGYGQTYAKLPFKFMLEFRDLEEFARKNQKGLWGSPPTTTRSTDAPAIPAADKRTPDKVAVKQKSGSQGKSTSGYRARGNRGYYPTQSSRSLQLMEEQRAAARRTTAARPPS